VKAETPEEREAVEVACFEEVKRQVSGDPILKRDMTIVHDIRLEGSYPDTCIAADVQRFARRATLSWKLWPEGNGDFGGPPLGGGHVGPAMVARDIIVDLYEF
jgi:hypothetical protein